MIAADCSPQFHVAAYHAKAGYNSETPGLGVLCNTSADTRIAAGAYQNSIGRQSIYATAVWQPVSFRAIRFGAMAGLVTGYKSVEIPFAAFVISAPFGPIEAHAAVIPEAPGVGPATAELSFSFRFK